MLGIGWRPELAWSIQKRDDIQFVEILAEDFCAQHATPAPLQKLIENGVEVVVHGTTLNLGGADYPELASLSHLNDLARKFNSPYISEHIAFVKSGGLDSGHLLPIPRTQDTMDILVENIKFAQAHLDVPLVLENIATLFGWPDDVIDEASFITEILERTNTKLLLDVANLYANSVNQKFDAIEFLMGLPLDRIAYVHVAGGVFKDSFYHDTHCHPVRTQVKQILEHLCERIEAPRVMLERDGLFPPEAELFAELDGLAEIYNRQKVRVA